MALTRSLFALSSSHGLRSRSQKGCFFRHSIFVAPKYSKATAIHHFAEGTSKVKSSLRRRRRLRMNRNLSQSTSGNKKSNQPDLHNHVSLEQLESSIGSVRDKMYEIDSNFKYRGYHTLRWFGGVSFLAFLALYVFRREIKEEIGSTGAEITTITLSDQEVMNQTKIFLKKLMEDEENINVFIEFLTVIGKNEYFQVVVGDLFTNVLQLDSVKKQIELSAIYGAHQTLNDEKVYDHLVECATSVLAIPEVHEPAANEFLKALKASFFPGIFSSSSPASPVVVKKEVKPSEEKDNCVTD